MAILKDFSNGVDGGLVRSHAAEQSALADKARSAAGAARKYFQQMKADGINMKAYKRALELMKMDIAEALKEINDTYYYLKALNSQIGDQLNFHEMTDNDAKTEEERAIAWTKAGASAYIAGKRATDNPYTVDMPAGQCWLTGWREAESEHKSSKKKEEAAAPDEGAKVVADAKKKAADQKKPAAAPADGTKRPRGRPPKSGPQLAAVDGVPVPQTAAPAPPAPETEAEEDDGDDGSFPVPAPGTVAPPHPPMFDEEAI